MNETSEKSVLKETSETSIVRGHIAVMYREWDNMSKQFFHEMQKDAEKYRRRIQKQTHDMLQKQIDDMLQKQTDDMFLGLKMELVSYKRQLMSSFVARANMISDSICSARGFSDADKDFWDRNYVCELKSPDSEPIPGNESWLNHFEWWLGGRVKDGSTKQKYMKAVTGLVNGDGIPYPKNYNSNVVFHAGDGFPTLMEFMAQDLKELKHKAMAHEKKYAKDKSNGNLFRIPIAHLLDYQKYMDETLPHHKSRFHYFNPNNSNPNKRRRTTERSREAFPEVFPDGKQQAL